MVWPLRALQATPLHPAQDVVARAQSTTQPAPTLLNSATLTSTSIITIPVTPIRVPITPITISIKVPVTPITIPIRAPITPITTPTTTLTSTITTSATPSATPIPVFVTSVAESGPVPPTGYYSTVTPTPSGIYGPVGVALDATVPSTYATLIEQMLRSTPSLSTGSWLKRPLTLVTDSSNALITIRVTDAATARLYNALPLVAQTYVVVAPFDTVRDEISLDELRARWQGESLEPLYVFEKSAIGLTPLLGPARISTLSLDKWQALFKNTPDSIGILPFDYLSPAYKVLAVNGVNPLDNQLRFGDYALTAALVVEGRRADLIVDLLQPVVGRQTNRDNDRLTTLLMTGVTAMSRGTAAMMEQEGYTFPAEIISDTLSAADITHISNEVPFLDNCAVNNADNNLRLCSHVNYSATLHAIGTDIIGLSGNHVNDFGRAGARKSINFYRRNGFNIYGSGLNTQEACKPLRWEHNGNTFAFLATLAYEPSFAWATDELPGACYYGDHKEDVLASVRQLAQEVDIVAVELQYFETYNPYPSAQQVIDFREVRAAGANIVTGVQSHVPQAMEPYGIDDSDGAGMVIYGLGNLFFDQMWSWQTRTGLIARHTIYQGRLISTEILTTVLEDFAQPRWTTEDERIKILERIFSATPERPKVDSP